MGPDIGFAIPERGSRCARKHRGGYIPVCVRVFNLNDIFFHQKLTLTARDMYSDCCFGNDYFFARPFPPSLAYHAEVQAQLQVGRFIKRRKR